MLHRRRPLQQGALTVLEISADCEALSSDKREQANPRPRRGLVKPRDGLEARQGIWCAGSPIGPWRPDRDSCILRPGTGHRSENFPPARSLPHTRTSSSPLGGFETASIVRDITCETAKKPRMEWAFRPFCVSRKSYYSALMQHSWTGLRATRGEIQREEPVLASNRKKIVRPT